MADGSPGAEKSPGQVDVERFAPQLGACLLEGHDRVNPGVQHKDRDLAEAGLDVAEGAVDGLLVAHVAGDPEHPLVGRWLEVEAGDERPVFVQHFGDAVADAPAAPVTTATLSSSPSTCSKGLLPSRQSPWAVP